MPDDASTLVAYPRAPSVSDIFVDLAPTLREEEAAEDETHIWEPSAPPGVALVDEPDAPYLASILAPSAPLEVAPPLVTEDTSQRHTQRRVATLALPGSVLESIFPLTGSSVHAQEWVKEFQGLADPIGQEIMTFEDGYRESKGFPGKKDIYEETRDEFLDNLCVYEMAFFEHERLKLQSDALQKQLEGTARRVWVLQTRTETFQAICQDGVKLTHHFASESATLDSKTFSELTTLLTGLHEENHSLSVDALFRSKRARIWIQNYLDSWMAQSSLMSSYSNLHVPNEEVTQHKTSLSFLAPTPPASSDRQRIHILLHILFHFEKRHQGKNDSGIASAPILEDYGFVKDVRGWITYLIAGFLPYMSFKDARLILLHVLRCRGIGNWWALFDCVKHQGQS